MIKKKEAVNIDGWKKVMRIMSGKIWVDVLLFMWETHNGSALHEISKGTGFPKEMCAESLLYLEGNNLIQRKEKHFFVTASGKFVAKLLLEIKSNVNNTEWIRIFS